MFLVIVSVLIYLTRKMCALSTYTLMITISCYHRPLNILRGLWLLLTTTVDD